MSTSYTTRGVPRCCGAPLEDLPTCAAVRCRKCRAWLSYASLVRAGPMPVRHATKRRGRPTSKEAAMLCATFADKNSAMERAIDAWEHRVMQALGEAKA